MLYIAKSGACFSLALQDSSNGMHCLINFDTSTRANYDLDGGAVEDEELEGGEDGSNSTNGTGNLRRQISLNEAKASGEDVEGVGDDSDLCRRRKVKSAPILNPSSSMPSSQKPS